MTAQMTRDLADRHFAALAQKDLTTLRSLLHDDLAFKGPLATLDNAEAYLQGIGHVTAGVTRMERRALVATDEEAFQVYDVSFGALDTPVPVTEWLRIRDNRIAAIELFLDPRPLLTLQPE
jgi:hypothetical protein